ncbi:hypothetical protein ACLOJK_020059 [Asimina triloba]
MLYPTRLTKSRLRILERISILLSIRLLGLSLAQKLSLHCCLLDSHDKLPAVNGGYLLVVEGDGIRAIGEEEGTAAVHRLPEKMGEKETPTI